MVPVKHSVVFCYTLGFDQFYEDSFISLTKKKGTK